ncbi:hypothetical protein NP233_g11475 [Leucocoprinus birnbaumii]|uniref:Transmembrane protein n=1 Tax=Leucocoprinus birnbaumii TaxID=56174 RepID=A0AAD5VMG8_9AGAR|nr:hypothetical protein NP233_g11475 [Leucocoprinus birnbaumii]
MQDKLFHTRNAVLFICISLSLSALGLSAHWISATMPVFFDFEGLTDDLALPEYSLAVGAFRKNATLTSIAVELPVLIILSALFLAEGVVLNTDLQTVAPFGCNDPFEFSPLQMKFCNELVSLKGVSYSLFAILITWWLPLLIMVVIEMLHGRNTLMLSVREAKFSLHTQKQANKIANGILEEMGVKNKKGADHQHTDFAQQQQQQMQQQQQQDPQIQLQQQQEQQIQLQQLQLQQLQQQQAMLQQQQFVQPPPIKQEV